MSDEQLMAEMPLTLSNLVALVGASSIALRGIDASLKNNPDEDGVALLKVMRDDLEEALINAQTVIELMAMDADEISDLIKMLKMTKGDGDAKLN